ncbi:MAG TPA: hypothetical protein VIL97_07355, partial [Thermoanaerobaculia bacterium]
MELSHRRAQYFDEASCVSAPLTPEELKAFDGLDLLYRALCAMLYNYVPMSGHPGGSISSGRFVQSVLFDAMDYDLGEPDRTDADRIVYAAGHKALGLYALWALRNEIARIGATDLLPPDTRQQLRLEDLLGFRRNPITATPLFNELHVKALDGHPTPATPFVPIATGASGVGFAAALGLALAASDFYGDNAPRVHIIEGEGGLTPGRIAEALAFAGTASLGNVVVHLDWNQSSIDSDRVTREGDVPGDYVQWNPMELFYLQDWNVVEVPNGIDFPAILAAQKTAASIRNGQPTAIVYRTTKGWGYGIEGRASHGAGHKLCSAGFYDSIQDFLNAYGVNTPACEIGLSRCRAGAATDVVESCFFESLMLIRNALEANEAIVAPLAARLVAARERLDRAKRAPRNEAIDVDRIYALAAKKLPPKSLELAPGTTATLRGQLGAVLHEFNAASDGAMLISAADLLGSTSINAVAAGFGQGYYNAKTNPDARLFASGGICEDAMSAILSGVSSFGAHIGVGSSYGAFLAPLGHIAARLHAIGAEAKKRVSGEAYKPMILVCAHAGLKTGEDGPTHADPQALQLLQENFPPGTMITLTPWDPNEIWTLVATALAKRPAVIAPFVTRPTESIVDRAKLRLAHVEAASGGVYRLRTARGEPEATIVLQESAVAYAFVETALPLLDRAGIDIEAYYVASAELFDSLPRAMQDAIFPESKAMEAMGITGFTLPTMFRWIRSDIGRAHTLHPYRKGHFLGSGPGEVV